MQILHQVKGTPLPPTPCCNAAMRPVLNRQAQNGLAKHSTNFNDWVLQGSSIVWMHGY